MRKIRCSGAIFLDGKNRILLEDRRKIRKHGEHWSFFGGTMKDRETKEETLKREIWEEMHYKIRRYSFFKKYTFTPIKTLHLTYYMYIAPCPKFNEIIIHKKASAKLFTLNQALKLRITDIDKKIIMDIQRSLSKIRSKFVVK